MSARERQRNNVLTGTFVLGSLVGIVIIVVTLSGVWTDLTRATRDHTVVFAVQDGVANLRKGAPVRVGGVEMGRVSRVRPRYPADGSPLEALEVDFRIDHRVTLFSNADMGIRAPLLGTDPWIEITSVGWKDERLNGTPSEVTVNPPVLQAAEAGAMLDTMLGAATAESFRTIVGRLQSELEDGDTLLAAIIGAEAMSRLMSLLDESGDVMVNARDLSAWMAGLPEEYQLRVVPILEDTAASAQSVRQVTGALSDEQWPRWSSQVDMLLVDLNRGVEEGALLVEEARSTIAEVRPTVVSVVEGADSVVQRLNDETVGRLNAALDQLAEAVDVTETVVARIGADYPQWSSYVGETLSRLSLAAQQTQLASIEIRRSPWKVLYRPGPKELEHELLYEAARSFALAAGDLRAAGGAVQRLMDMHGEALSADPDLVKRLTDYLGGPLDRYEGAQRALFDLLLEQEP